MKEGEGGRREKRKTRKEREDSKSEKKREDHRQYGKWDENDTLFIIITCISIQNYNHFNLSFNHLLTAGKKQSTTNKQDKNKVKYFREKVPTDTTGEKENTEMFGQVMASKDKKLKLL